MLNRCKSYLFGRHRGREKLLGSKFLHQKCLKSFSISYTSHSASWPHLQLVFNLHSRRSEMATDYYFCVTFSCSIGSLHPSLLPCTFRIMSVQRSVLMGNRVEINEFPVFGRYPKWNPWLREFLELFSFRPRGGRRWCRNEKLPSQTRLHSSVFYIRC